MARLPRIVVPNQPLHIMHRGNNRQDIFESEEDMTRIQEDIAYALAKSSCSLHAYVIMSNHLHLLITPAEKTQLSQFMQTMANRYVRYFNATRNRTGTIWEGRFKSCLIDSENYLFSLYRYIEMNPVKANMVKKIADYPWSSYRHNALGEENCLITEHELYRGLGESVASRTANYQKIFNTPSSESQEQQITEATIRGEVYGSSEFHHKISQLISRTTKLTSHGGDRKSEDYIKIKGSANLICQANSNRLIAIGQSEIELDAAGNTLSDRNGQRRFEYNQQGRLSAIYQIKPGHTHEREEKYTNGKGKHAGKDKGKDDKKGHHQHEKAKTKQLAEYTYNALGQRTQKQLGDKHQHRTVYHYDLTGQLLAESHANLNNPGKDYIWLNNRPLAQLSTKQTKQGETKTGQIIYLHTDHLNTPRIVTDKEAEIVWRWHTDAFGNELNTAQEDEWDEQDDDEDGHSKTEQYARLKPSKVNLRFPGQYYDWESGLYYNWFRYYDPSTGRYITSDPIGLEGGLNTYGYVGGNPLSFFDPNGLICQAGRHWKSDGGRGRCVKNDPPLLITEICYSCGSKIVCQSPEKRPPENCSASSGPACPIGVAKAGKFLASPIAGALGASSAVEKIVGTATKIPDLITQ